MELIESDGIVFPKLNNLFRDQGEAHAAMLSLVTTVSQEMAELGYPAPDHQLFAQDITRLWRDVWSKFAP